MTIDSTIEKQRLASNPEYSVWVGASAGTGKTKILTDRVVRLLLNDVPSKQILCLTYTKAAAQEMIDRIHDKLASWSIISEEQLREELVELSGSINDQHLSRARGLFSNIMQVGNDIAIKTIHSFCYNIISRFSMEAGLPYGCQVAEQGTDDLLHDTISLLLKSNKPFRDDFKLLFQHMHYRRILQVLSEAIEQKVHLESIESMTDILVKFLHLEDLEVFDEDLVLQGLCLSTNSQLLKFASIALPEANKSDIPLLQEIIIWHGDGHHMKTQERLATYVKLLSRKRILSKKLLENNTDFHDLLMKEKARTTRCLDTIMNIMLITKNKLLHSLVSILSQKYLELKLQNKTISYDDVIDYCLVLLSNPEHSDWIRYKLDQQITHILVDEAQDTSLVQWRIIDKLCEEFFVSEHPGTLFAVGDVKQSIYSFQDAVPSEFIQAGQYFHDKAKNKKFAIVTLEYSFRSTYPILRLTDMLCNDQDLNQSINLSHIPIKHVPYFDDKKGYVVLFPPFARTKKEDRIFMQPLFSLSDQTHIEKTSHLIVGHIQSLISKQNIPPQDIMVLVRKRDRLYRNIIMDLVGADIPCSGSDKVILNQYPAVQDLIVLGEFLVYQHNDLSLATLLRSPILNFSEQELFDIAYDRGDKSLWERICDDNEAKIYEAKQYLVHLIEASQSLDIYGLYHLILYEYNAIQYFQKILGQESVEVIQAFLAEILRYQNINSPILRNFIRYIKTTDVEFKNEFIGNKVRVMTIHGAKGLQSPYIFLADQGYRSKNDKSVMTITIEDQVIPVMKPLVDQMSSEMKELVKQEDMVQYEEYWRLLYVAITRAKFYLYIFTLDINSPWYKKILEIMQNIGAKIPEGEAYIYDPYKQYQGGGEPYTNQSQAYSYKYQAIPNKEDWRSLPEHGIERAGALEEIYANTYGTCVHKMLEMLSDIQYNDCSEQELVLSIEKIYQILSFSLPQRLYRQLMDEVVRVRMRPDLRFLFVRNASSEVPFGGNGVNIVVDKLIVSDHEVIIADFKTGDITPDLLLQYKRQMLLYRNIVGQVYLGRNIKCYLIYTKTASMLEV